MDPFSFIWVKIGALTLICLASILSAAYQLNIIINMHIYIVVVFRNVICDKTKARFDFDYGQRAGYRYFSQFLLPRRRRKLDTITQSQ